MKIVRINLKSLRNEAHYQFLAAVTALIVKFPFIASKLGDLFRLLQSLFAKEDEVVDYIRKSDYSAKIAEADERLDKAVTGFSETVRGALHHFRLEVADAALSLKNLLKPYGDIIHKNYDEELAAMTNLLQDLEGAYATSVALISGLSEWVTEIKAASENVTTLLALRNTEKAVRLDQGIRKFLEVTLRQAACQEDLLAGIEPAVGEDGVYGLLFGAFDEAAGVDDDKVRGGGILNRGPGGPVKHGHHGFSVHLVFCAAEGVEEIAPPFLCGLLH